MYQTGDYLGQKEQTCLGLFVQMSSSSLFYFFCENTWYNPSLYNFILGILPLKLQGQLTMGTVNQGNHVHIFSWTYKYFRIVISYKVTSKFLYSIISMVVFKLLVSVTNYFKMSAYFCFCLFLNNKNCIGLLLKTNFLLN